jgi:hypothetical protein
MRNLYSEKNALQWRPKSPRTDPRPHHYPIPNPRACQEDKQPKGEGSLHPPQPKPRRPISAQQSPQTDQNLPATF